MQKLCRILKRNFRLFANHTMMIQKETTRNKFFFRLGVKASPCTNLCKSKYATSQDCSCGRYKKTTRRQLLIDGKATLSAQQRCWVVHHTCNASSISGFSFSVENRARKRRGSSMRGRRNGSFSFPFSSAQHFPPCLPETSLLPPLHTSEGDHEAMQPPVMRASITYHIQHSRYDATHAPTLRCADLFPRL